MQIKGSVAVVTGGASGLGEACVRGLFNKGAKVSILDFVRDKGERLASELGDATLFCLTDVTNEDHIREAIDKTVKEFGSIQVTVNCAGIGFGSKVLDKNGPMNMESFNRVVQVHLMGTMNSIRFAAAKMVGNEPNEDGERGVIINTSSASAFEGQIGQAAYSAAKAGIAGMTLPIAREFAAYGIRVVTIAPGFFDTPILDGLPEKVKESFNRMIPFPKRFGKAFEFAQLAIQIVENPMLNGCSIRLDGALRMP